MNSKIKIGIAGFGKVGKIRKKILDKIPEVKIAEENSVEPKAEEKKPVEEKSESSASEAEKTNDGSKS